MIDLRRTQQLNDGPVGEGPVLYVMGRDQRVADSWPLLYAAERANNRKVALKVLFVIGPMFQHGTARHNEWLISSLKDVAEGLTAVGVSFSVRTGDWVGEVLAGAASCAAGEVVFDFNPLEPVRSWREHAAAQLHCQVTMVDGRNIIPCWEASPKAEFAAYTFRPKVHRQLREYLVPFPKLSVAVRETAQPIDWVQVGGYRTVDAVPLPPGWVPGEQAGKRALRSFLAERLVGYASKRNDPNADGVSGLSPYLRWGNLSAQRVALAVQETRAPKDDKDAFLEELIVRRELADNFVYYTEGYTTLAGVHLWARETLVAHQSDPREYCYTRDQFEAAATHDPLWNAMQRQMVVEGKMHGWCRMYWAKKILEWTPDPQTAIDTALYLNDRYELDGRDSNGVVGVMWSIAGVHDRAWTERPIFGKVRYMNFAGAKRKFDVAAYIDRYSGSNSLFND